MNTGRKFDFALLSKYRDVLMGMQILLIMLFHFTEDCKLSSIHFNRFVSLFYHYIGSSGVDVFLFLSGLGLYFSWKKNPDARSFYRKRFERILIPYGMVAVLAWGWYDLFYSQMGFWQFVKDFTFISFFTDGTKWFWYIFMVIISYLLFPYFFQMVEGAQNAGTEKTALLSVWSACTIFAVMMQLYDQELYLNISVALMRFPAFFLGCMAGKYSYENRKVSSWKIYVSVVLAFVAGVMLHISIKPLMGFYSRALLNLCVCLALVMILETVSEGNHTSFAKICNAGEKVLAWFGKYSLEFYLLHVAIRKVMNTLGYHTYEIGYEVVMLLITSILVLLLKKGSSVVTRLLEHR